jgi:hypothetical protein
VGSVLLSLFDRRQTRLRMFHVGCTETGASICHCSVSNSAAVQVEAAFPHLNFDAEAKAYFQQKVRDKEKEREEGERN